MSYPIGICSVDLKSFMVEHSREEIVEFFNQTHQLDDPDDVQALYWRDCVINTLYQNLQSGLNQGVTLDNEVARGAASVLMNMLCSYGICHFYEYGSGYLDFLSDLGKVAPEFTNLINFIERPMFGLSGVIMEADMFIGYIDSSEAKVLLQAFDKHINEIKEACYELDQNEDMTWSGALHTALTQAAQGKLLVLWYG